jgi:multidrug efflux system membrane fusion protein
MAPLYERRCTSRGNVPDCRRRRRIVIAAVLIVSAVVVYLHLKPAGSGNGKSGIPSVVISTVTAKTGDIGVYVNALGTVTPLNTVSLTAPVAGQIAKLEYQEGQLVHIGDPLVDIDPAPYQAAVIQAEGQLARDQAQLELAKVNLEDSGFVRNNGVASKYDLFGDFLCIIYVLDT